MTEITKPIPMLLWCPMCHERHIDQGEFADKPHHTHACQGCGVAWRPAIVPTCGVQFLPGFKDGDPDRRYMIGNVGNGSFWNQDTGSWGPAQAGTVYCRMIINLPPSGVWVDAKTWNSIGAFEQRAALESLWVIRLGGSDLFWDGYNWTSLTRAYKYRVPPSNLSLPENGQWIRCSDVVLTHTPVEQPTTQSAWMIQYKHATPGSVYWNHQHRVWTTLDDASYWPWPAPPPLREVVVEDGFWTIVERPVRS